jgi:hypothetical protein
MEVEPTKESIEQSEQKQPPTEVVGRPEPKPPGRQYDLPPDDFFMSPDEAEAALKRLHGDIKADGNHPYMDGSHPMHQDYLNYATALHEAAQTGENIYAEMMADVEAKEAERLGAIRADAQKDLDFLRDAGLENEEDVPADLPESKCALLKMRRLNQSDVPQDRLLLRQLLSDSLTSLPSTTPELQRLYGTFSMAEAQLDVDLARNIFDELILYLNRAGFEQARKKDPRRFGG